MKINDEILRMLKEVSQALDGAGVLYAVGGAVAMALHGARRETVDVDVFALEEARGKALRAIRDAGYRIEPIMESFLYAAWPPWETSDRDVRVDLRFPASEPELSGIERAQRIEIPGGLKVRVFSPLMLTLSRLYSNQPKHLADLSIMYHRGLIPADEVNALLNEYDPPMARRFRIIMHRIEHPPKRRRPPRRFGPGAFGERS